MKLTKRSVAYASVGTHWDDQLPGFGLRVLASGRRSYVVRFRTATGTDRTMTLGTAARASSAILEVAKGRKV